MKPLPTHATVEIRSLQPHLSNEGVNRAMRLATHAQGAVAGWTIGLSLLDLSCMRVINDGFGQSPHELLTQLSHHCGKVGQAHRLVLQIRLQHVEPLIKTLMQPLAELAQVMGCTYVVK